MARRKTLKAEPASKSTAELLAKMQQAVREAGLLDSNGDPIDDFDPLALLARIAADPRVKWTDRAACARELAKYIYAPLKSLESAGAADEPVTIILKRFGSDPNAEKISISVPRKP